MKWRKQSHANGRVIMVRILVSEQQWMPKFRAEEGDFLNIHYEQVKALRSLLYDRAPAVFPGDDFQGTDLRDIYDIMQELRSFLVTLAEGELSTELKTKGYVAGLLKTLQANLRHVTWQTQRIAEGDYSHNVEFLGEFSSAFNQMKNQLAEVTQALKKQAETDGLTGLLNHSAIVERIKTEAERNKRYGDPFAIIMLDPKSTRN